MKAKTDVEKWIDSQLPADGVSDWRWCRFERVVTIDGDQYFHTRKPNLELGEPLTESDLWKIRSIALDYASLNGEPNLAQACWLASQVD